MQDADRVERRRALRDLDAVIEDLRDRQRAAGEARRKRLARQVLHDQEVEAVGVTDVVQHADVRMADRGDGAGFALESFARVAVLGDACRQNLDGDRAIEACRAPWHFAHAAHAGGTRLIRTNPSADEVG